MLGGPRPRPAAAAQVVVDRLEARHRAGGEPGSEALLLGRPGSGEARHAVLHVDVDTRVAQLGAACERLSHRALDGRIVRLHGLLLRRRHHLELVHDALHAARLPSILLGRRLGFGRRHHAEEDRKSTRLNSSHLVISYAVFCLKKKKKETPAANSYPRLNYTPIY